MDQLSQNIYWAQILHHHLPGKSLRSGEEVKFALIQVLASGKNYQVLAVS
jgi:hypothetical protein